DLAKLRDCSAKRQSVLPTAECMTVRPSAANRARMTSNGQSKARKIRASSAPRRFMAWLPWKTQKARSGRTTLAQLTERGEPARAAAWPAPVREAWGADAEREERADAARHAAPARRWRRRPSRQPRHRPSAPARATWARRA